MSETKLKTVGDCVNLCKSAGIEISHLDDNLFETAGAISGLLDKIAQLEKEKYESIGAWNSQLEKASARVKELEQENAELKKRLQNAQSDAIELVSKERKRWAREDLGALAERDKKVKIETIDKFVNLLLNFKGRELSEGDEYTVELVANQLKRQ